MFSFGMACVHVRVSGVALWLWWPMRAMHVLHGYERDFSDVSVRAVMTVNSRRGIQLVSSAKFDPAVA